MDKKRTGREDSHPVTAPYTRSTLPDLSARAETQTFLGLPSTRIRTFCTLIPQVRFVLFNACERLFPDFGDFPVT